jgi:CheY-like chemotaxis protein/CHASE3 domain sensor protein
VLSKNLLIGHRIIISFSVALVALIAVGVFNLRSLDDMQREATWVTHTIKIMAELRQLNESVARIESAGRGYLLAGEPSLKSEFTTEQMNAMTSLRKLRTLTGDNANQTPRLDLYEVLLARRIELAQGLVDLRDNRGNTNDARVTNLVRDGQKISEELRGVAASFSVEEARLLVIRQEAASSATALARNTVTFGSLGALLLVSVSGIFLARSITRPLAELRNSANRIGEGDSAHRADVTTNDEIGHLSAVFNRMAAQVQQRQAVLENQDWLKSGLARFSALFQQQRDTVAVSSAVLSEFATLLQAPRSAIYRVKNNVDGIQLELCASYAAEKPPAFFAAGEGLVGQCYTEKQRIVLQEVPADYLRIGSALGATQPVSLIVEPVKFENQMKAVMELASLRPFTALQLELIERLAASLGIVLQNIENASRTEDMLRQSQALTAQLGTQQLVLAEQNTELESQANRLRKSEQLLREQQVELTQTNAELEQTNEEMEQANEEMEEKTNLLANQKRELENSHRASEQARAELQAQTRQLTITSTYKSNFLATMSHELRTPLNSLLILARLLAENRDTNLSPKQVQFAQTIESSGADLLEMINQILDLAKIESGTVELQLDDLVPADLRRSIEHQFHHMAEAKKLQFEVTLGDGLPSRLHTDVGRFHQIIKNLLSNAVKFTEKGSVKIDIRTVTSGWAHSTVSLNNAASVVAIAVTDTGIGIPKDKQEIIFESFQQADAGTARRFGGTGLGLSISREIAAMLGGELQLESDLGKGSTFTLYVPAVLDEKVLQSRAANFREVAKPAAPESKSVEPVSSEISLEQLELEDPDIRDDRDTIVPSDRVILIIEDDSRFAAILVDFAHDKRFKVLVARSARHGLALALRFLPVAITLDLHLVDEDGWLVLDRLKHDQRTRHIPVHVISVAPGRNRGLRLGAVSYLQKPVSKDAIDHILQQTVDFIERPVKSLLVVEDDAVQRDTIKELIGNNDVHTTAVGSAAEALKALESERYDCIVMDLILPDQSGADLIREINRRLGLHAPPVIVYTGKELTPREETELRSLSESIIVKDARSPERLLDETALFLHRVQSRLPEAKRRMLEQVRKQDPILTGRRVLVVDDDVRNIFAITAALESYGMIVKFAESGKTAIEMLQVDSDCDAVLMDVMMPEMDGNEATRRLRTDSRFAKLPIIAVTAKAMKGDRERSIEAGASDYITKPVDTEKLLSLLRVWLYR